MTGENAIDFLIGSAHEERFVEKLRPELATRILESESVGRQS